MLKDSLNLLIEYAKINLDLSFLNAIYAKNTLMKKFNLNEEDDTTDLSVVSKLSRPDEIIDRLSKELIDEQIASSDNINLLIDEIFGELSLSPNEFVNKFEAIKNLKGSYEALDYFYQYQIKNNYIQKSAIERNILWSSNEFEYPIELSINLSKPEKKNSDIAKLKLFKSSSYPKCLLCKENLGFFGDFKRASRRTIRYIPLILDKQLWYLQYSPYGYFNKHAICFSDSHQDMIINRSTFVKLLEFVNLYPSFFMGSNADLPIVGGSILNHEHFQGGDYELPIFKSNDRIIINSKKYPGLKISILDWYNSTVKIVGDKIEDIANYAEELLNTYQNFDKEDILLFSHHHDIIHSTITPIARMESKQYALYLILRNNYTNKEHPDGVFHAHKKYHHIKSEGIGLIEAMGLFILPPRLINELKEVRDILTSKKKIDQLRIDHFSLQYQNMIKTLVEENGTYLTNKDSEKLIKYYINNVCRNILINTAVFKNNQIGNKYFLELLDLVG